MAPTFRHIRDRYVNSCVCVFIYLSYVYVDIETDVYEGSVTKNGEDGGQAGARTLVHKKGLNNSLDTWQKFGHQRCNVRGWHGATHKTRWNTFKPALVWPLPCVLKTSRPCPDIRASLYHVPCWAVRGFVNTHQGTRSNCVSTVVSSLSTLSCNISIVFRLIFVQ